MPFKNLRAELDVEVIKALNVLIEKALSRLEMKIKLFIGYVFYLNARIIDTILSED